MKTVLTAAGPTMYSYDYDSRMTGIVFPDASTNSFSYNGLDARVGMVNKAGTSSTFSRDGASATSAVLSDYNNIYCPPGRGVPIGAPPAPWVKPERPAYRPGMQAGESFYCGSRYVQV